MIKVYDRFAKKEWKVLGLRNAAAETRELAKEAGRRNPGHIDIWYDRTDGHLWTTYCLPGEWSVPRTGDNIKVMTAYGPTTMESIKRNLVAALEGKTREKQRKQIERED